MKLYLEHNGELHLVSDDVDEYDLNKPFAQSVISERIRKEIERVKASEQKV